MDEDDQKPLLNDDKADGKSLKSLTSFLTDDERFQFEGQIPGDADYSNWFQFSMFLVAVTAGILQGYQIGIIAGIELYLPDEYKGIVVSEDGSETAGDHGTSTKERELFVSFYALGAVFGTFFGGQLCDAFGRRNMAICGDFIIASGFLTIIFTDAISLGFIGRAVSGVGSGIQSFAIPLYLNEVGNPKWNKIVTACFTLFTGVGMLTGLNLAIPVRHHWRLLFEFGLIPVALQVLLMCFLPESQSYYINKGDNETALEVIKVGLGDQDAEFELARLKYEKQFFVSDKISLGRKYKDLCTVFAKPLWICLGLSFFGQAVGTSAFLYYGAEIFYETQADLEGIDERQESALILDDFVLGAFVIGNLISAFIIYKAGRKLMMLIALPFAFVALLLLAYTMKEANYGDDEDTDEGAKQAYRHTERIYFTIVICVYTLSVAIGLSITIWGITSEILPNYLLATGSSLSQSFGWLVNFIINSFFLDALEDPAGKWIVFLVFAGFVFLAILFVIFCVPETVGKSTKENLTNLLGREALHKQRKVLRKDYDIIDVEVTNPTVLEDFEKKKNAYKMASFA